MQSPCNPLIDDYTEIFYMIDEGDIPSIPCKMILVFDLRWVLTPRQTSRLIIGCIITLALTLTLTLI
jgi:hypothetical protein